MNAYNQKINLSDEERYYRWDTFFLIFTILSEPFFFYLVLILNLHIKICDYISGKINIFLFNLFLSFIAFALLHWAIYFPLNFIRSYYIDKKFKLSNQSFKQWFKDHIKIGLLKGVFIFIILVFMYYVLSKMPTYWWLVSFVFTSIIYIILAVIAPLVILPLFFKLKPIENEELKIKILQFIEKIKLKVRIENIFEVDLSKKTNAANAAVMGFGKTKRIAFSDTLLNQFSADEIEAVLAHELGHIVNKHHIKGTFISIVFLFTFFFTTNLIAKNIFSFFNIETLATFSSIPLFALIFSVEGILMLPILNTILRRFEFAADLFGARNSTNPNALISALERLSVINLIKKEPNPIVESLFYSHPSIKKRIDYLKSRLRITQTNL